MSLGTKHILSDSQTVPQMAIPPMVVPSIDNPVFSRTQMRTNSLTTSSSLHAENFLQALCMSDDITQTPHCTIPSSHTPSLTPTQTLLCSGLSPTQTLLCSELSTPGTFSSSGISS